MIYGNIDGIRKTVLEELQEIYEIKIEKNDIANEELIDILCKLTEQLNREISVGISRKGNIVAVSVGDSTTVEMPEIEIKSNKLSGIRIIHTHPNGNPKLSSVDLSALLKLKLDCMVAIGVDCERPTGFGVAFCAMYNSKLSIEEKYFKDINSLLDFNFLNEINYIEQNFKNEELEDDKEEKVILISIDDEESIDELEELAKACNLKVVEKVLQNKNKIDSAYYIGKGKVGEISLIRQALNADAVIFDDELSASQIRNLEEAVGAKVIDRNTLILDIFARRAKSKESKIQVELAQLKYRLPRLTGLGLVLSRTGGGIGTRGPGEKKLETDKRHIKERIYDLKKELYKIKKVRETQRSKRNDIPKVSLVGYTNAGKSTLRNKLCDIGIANTQNKEKVFEADMLFATLDTTTRAVSLPNNEIITLTDTVGFVRKLPHELIEAFKSTLEEVIYSDLLLHVIDISSDSAEKQVDAVNNVLQELGAENKSIILVFNKIDKVSIERLNYFRSKFKEENFIEISAKLGINLEDLLKLIEETLPYKLTEVEYIIPYDKQQIVAFLHRNSKIIEEKYREEGTYIRTRVDNEVYNKCNEFLLK
ncbi:GTPase HflX [Clostridium tepidum]|jgi:GTP-binding protein HflX|uniref:GTPase HflX n=1 Tax=Clostridium tepidum TaxID=1962263 RepID=A0A1S9I389_9CLOT|nr:GTPase HflX [Clostridium tepidum]MCR1935257.1 GTPase HflX [Clostridium tepidum]MDU6878623.1 GTPase HflX [Clostridium botulinum]OOO61943.1 GTPase HflX [Clostridium tepidum]OOO64750.1 GTPase HflX [Clostridium tepidum]